MLLGDSDAQTFMIAGGLVYEIVAAACSSPQTTEINADARADTLMKWVYLGLGQAAVFVIIAALMDKSHWAALSGGLLAGAFMWTSYAHAKAAGLNSNEPGTETYA